MIKNYDDYRHEIEMLDGNIARISLSDDMREIDYHYAVAKMRLECIYNYRKYGSVLKSEID